MVFVLARSSIEQLHDRRMVGNNDVARTRRRGEDVRNVLPWKLLMAEGGTTLPNQVIFQPLMACRNWLRPTCSRSNSDGALWPPGFRGTRWSICLPRMAEPRVHAGWLRGRRVRPRPSKTG